MFSSADDEDPKQQLITIDEEFELVSKDDYVEMRGAKIAHVAESLDTIHTLYDNIN